MVDWTDGLLAGHTGATPGAEADPLARPFVPTIAGRLANAPTSTPVFGMDMPLPGGYIARALGGLLGGGETLEEQFQDHERRLQEAYRQAGAVTPEQQSRFRMTHTEHMDPVGQQLTSFIGNIRGVSPNRAQLQLRGTSQPATEIAESGFPGRRRSVELNMPGWSTTSDSRAALQYGQSPNPVRWEPPVPNPEHVSRVTVSADPSTWRNVRPGEFAALGDTMPTPGVRQPTALREAGQPTFRPAQEPVLRLPQSEMPQAETFIPQRGGATITGRVQTPEAMAQQREQLTRQAELTERQRTATTPAGRLLLARDLAEEARGSRTRRPTLPGELSETATLPDAPTMRALFPEDVAALEQLQQRSGALNTTYNTQGDMAQRIREAIRGTRGTITPDIRQQMNALDESYRGFTSGNTGFMQETANLPRTRTHVAAQDLIMRDLEANATRARVPLAESVANAQPVVQAVGMRPDQFAHALRDPEIYAAAARRDPQLERMLRSRLDVMQMAE